MNKKISKYSAKKNVRLVIGGVGNVPKGYVSVAKFGNKTSTIRNRVMSGMMPGIELMSSPQKQFGHYYVDEVAAKKFIGTQVQKELPIKNTSQKVPVTECVKAEPKKDDLPVDYHMVAILRLESRIEYLTKCVKNLCDLWE